MNAKCVQTPKAAQTMPRRAYKKYGGLVKLAAEFCGKSESAVYAVIYGRNKSPDILHAIKRAENRLQREAEREVARLRREADRLRREAEKRQQCKKTLLDRSTRTTKADRKAA